mgnify:CR=1 FL=1|jgi:hypothetical protein
MPALGILSPKDVLAHLSNVVFIAQSTGVKSAYARNDKRMSQAAKEVSLETGQPAGDAGLLTVSTSVLLKKVLYYVWQSL